MSRDGVPVTDSFRFQEDGIEEVPVDFIADFEGFSTVEEEGDV